MIVLAAGRKVDVQGISVAAVEIYQRAFDLHMADIAAERWAGTWISDDKRSVAVTVVFRGSLWLSTFRLNGMDVFKSVEGPHPVSSRYGLWPTGREDEFR